MYQVWDICKQSSMYTLETNQSAVSPDIHQSAPVFAVTTSTQNISLKSMYEGKLLSQIRYHEDLLGNRLGRQFIKYICTPDPSYLRTCELPEVPHHPGAAGSRQHSHILKLFQSSVRELRPILVFIWDKFLAVDSSCQQDLVRDQSRKNDRGQCLVTLWDKHTEPESLGPLLVDPATER